MKKVNSTKASKPGADNKDVDGYLAALPSDQRAALQKLRKAIKAAAPKAEETISYRMPAYKYHGVLAYYAAFKNHCSFFPAGKAILKTFAKELEPYDASGGTIRFTSDRPLPVQLVKKIIRTRLKQNEARRKKRAT